eukprot:COSAG04_NODE_325_length_16785_cov_23.851792_13_plen_99_part_00
MLLLRLLSSSSSSSHISCRYENCEFLPLHGEMHVLCTDHHSGKCYTPGAGAHLPPLSVPAGVATALSLSCSPGRVQGRAARTTRATSAAWRTSSPTPT